MKKTFEERLTNEKIVAIIRTSTEQKAIKTIAACLEGGIKIIEITFTIPNVSEVIKYAKSISQDVLIGAGTVMNVEQAQLAINLGCEFLVSPNLNEEIVQLCQTKKIIYLPGVMTINEITKAMDLGIQIVKLFPGNVFTPQYLQAIKGPLPGVKVMVTGGVNEKNIQEWLECGALGCGIGGNLIAPIEKNDDYWGCVKNAQIYLEAIK